jgi:uncharacterized OB-fold protein
MSSAAPNWEAGLPLRAGDMFLGLYQPSPETAAFWSALSRHELLIKCCPACGRHQHPRRMHCPDCGGLRLAWQRAGGGGRIYTYSEVHTATGIFRGSVPYTVGIVALDEGVHLFGRIVAEAGPPIAIDGLVRTEFRVLEQGFLLPVFVTADGAKTRDTVEAASRDYSMTVSSRVA